MKKQFDAYSVRGVLCVLVAAAGLIYNLLILPAPLILSVVISIVFLGVGVWLLTGPQAGS